MWAWRRQMAVSVCYGIWVTLPTIIQPLFTQWIHIVSNSFLKMGSFSSRITSKDMNALLLFPPARSYSSCAWPRWTHQVTAQGFILILSLNGWRNSFTQTSYFSNLISLSSGHHLTHLTAPFFWFLNTTSKYTWKFLVLVFKLKLEVFFFFPLWRTVIQLFSEAGHNDLTEEQTT